MAVVNKTSFITTQFLFFILVFSFAVRLITIGSYPLMDSTESRYAEIGREMLVTNNWITPQIQNGKPFWAKPPLSFWATATSFKIFGLNEFAARLPSVLFSVLTVLLTLYTGKRLFGKEVGLLAAAILATIGMFFVNAGSVMTDPSLCFSITLSLTSFFLIEADAKRRKLWGYLFFIGLGLSLLAKGPVGVVLTGLPFFFWIIFDFKRLKTLQRLPFFVGIPLMLLVAVPWYVAAEKATPGFWNYFIIGEHWMRYTVKNWKGDMYGGTHDHPKGMIWLLTIPALMPWIIVFGFYIYHFIQKKVFKPILNQFSQNDWLLVCWMLTPSIFFTAAGNILITYVTPAMPAFALVLARLISFTNSYEKLRQVKLINNPKVVQGFLLFVPIAFLIGSFFVLPVAADKKCQLKLVRHYQTLQKDPNGHLVYIKRMPDSAAFYSNGNARDVDDGEERRLLNYHYDKNHDFYVVYDEDMWRFPQLMQENSHEVARFHKYILFEENN